MALAAPHVPSITGAALAVNRLPDHAGLSYAIAVVICPVLLVGQDLSGHLEVAIAPLVLATVLMGSALLWIQHSDVPLEAAQ